MTLNRWCNEDIKTRIALRLGGIRRLLWPLKEKREEGLGVYQRTD